MGIAPVNTTKTVTTAGTRVQVTATSTYAPSCYFEALKTNTGIIYVGVSTVSATVYIAALSAGQGFSFQADSFGSVGSAAGGGELQLSSLYVDSSVSGEKVQFTYMQRLGQA
jgi:hypothetical protein